jgi:hypothetical protein
MTVGPARMVLGILLICVGVTGFVLFLVSSLSKIFKGLERIEVPGARELTLERGSYTINWETDSRFGSAASRSDLEITVVAKDIGGSPPVSGSGLMATRYSTLDGKFGASIAGFSVEAGGAYTLTVSAAAGKTLPKGRITVGRSVGFLGVLKIVVVCILIMGAGVGGGVALLVRKES